MGGGVTPKANDEKGPITGDKSDEEDSPRIPMLFLLTSLAERPRSGRLKLRLQKETGRRGRGEEMICRIFGDPGHFTQVLFPLSKLQLTRK
jgi:hypothetical protein